MQARDQLWYADEPPFGRQARRVGHGIVTSCLVAKCALMLWFVLKEQLLNSYMNRTNLETVNQISRSFGSHCPGLVTNFTRLGAIQALEHHHENLGHF